MGTVFASKLCVMKKIWTLLLLLCGITAGAQDLEGTFTQAKTLKISGHVIKSEGSFTYTAPDQLAMLYTKPDGDYFIIDGPFLRMDLRGVSLDVDTDRNKAVKVQRDAILYSMAGKYEEIAKEMDADFTVTPTKDGGKKVVLKVKKVAVTGYSGMELDYKKNGKLARMVLEEFGDIATEYVLNVK